MNVNATRLWLFALLFTCLPALSFACGYNYVGDCSTAIFLKINNSQDSFYCAHCPFGIQFDGLDFGTVRTLELPKATGTTWESCQNNVTGMKMYYRIYATAGGPPANWWQNLDLQQFRQTIEGPYTTRYRRAFPNMNLLAGLSIGTQYTMEVYFSAQVDTIGDDFIPEIQDFRQDNGGQNFRCTFTPGGPSGPPFTVVATHAEGVKCADDHTGIAAVSVYGDQNGLFYNWGNGTNFFEIFNLAAGTYTCTVSGASGYSQSKSIVITSESNISNLMTGIVPAQCAGIPGTATAKAAGGVEPYSYSWNTGEHAATGHFPKAGTWWLTVSDAIGCSHEYFVNIPAADPPTRALDSTICLGGVFNFGGQTFHLPGQYQITLPGPGCDTLVQLTLGVTDPSRFLDPLPGDTMVSCLHPTLDFCLNSAPPDVDFYWEKEGILVSTALCYAVNLPGNWQVTSIEKGCFAQKAMQVENWENPPAPVSMTTTDATGPHAANGSATVNLDAALLSHVDISWGNWGSGQSQQHLVPGQYCATVTDSWTGCTATVCATVGYTSANGEVFAENAPRLSPNPAADFLKIEWGNGSGDLVWQLLSASGQNLRAGETMLNGGAAELAVGDLAAGVYFLKIKVLGQNRVARFSKI